MERDFIKMDGDVTIIASHINRSVEIWSTGEKKLEIKHIDLGISEAFRMPEVFSVTWNSHRASYEKIQIDQMVWEGCPNID